MAEIILITGGAKSGKSLHAERLARQLSDAPIYIATAEARDEEMLARIHRHISRRGPEWTCFEEPRDLPRVLGDTDGQGARLVDCLTLWLSNEMLAEGGDWERGLKRLTDALPRQKSPVILVTNEVGSGIVPANALARAFQDAAGAVNQTIGALADRVDLVVCGQALTIKG